MCGAVPFEYMYDVARLKFCINSIPKCSFVYNLTHVFLSKHKIVCDIYGKYDIGNQGCST